MKIFQRKKFNIPTHTCLYIDGIIDGIFSCYWPYQTIHVVNRSRPSGVLWCSYTWTIKVKLPISYSLSDRKLVYNRNTMSWFRLVWKTEPWNSLDRVRKYGYMYIYGYEAKSLWFVFATVAQLWYSTYSINVKELISPCLIGTTPIGVKWQSDLAHIRVNFFWVNFFWVNLLVEVTVCLSKTCLVAFHFYS